jgi:RNA 2',3'-cyclic 3'-phosphodiesterase
VPPAAALDHLAGALRRLRDRADGPRWTARELQHVTLAFFGEVPEARVPVLTDALAAALGPVEVHLRLAGAGTFPARGDPRVLWVGVDGDVEQLAAVAGAAAEAGRSVGLDLDRRAYQPHVTVGRWAFSAHGDRKIANALGNYAGPHFTAGEIVLMRSQHGAAPRYETVAAWGGAPGDTVGTYHPTPR